MRLHRLVPVPLGLLLLVSTIRAHEREFTRSRDWHLPYAGEHELELRSYFDTTHGRFRGQLEYEYGVTRHFAIEPGLEIAENADGDHEIEGAGLELRFSFGDWRPSAWLPALDVEYEHPFEDEEADRVALKGILSRYGVHDDLTVNLNYERELEGERADGFAVTAGWLHRFDETVGESRHAPRLGLELTEDLENHHLRAGPLVTWRANRHWNLLASYLVAVDDRGDGGPDETSDELTVILEWEL